MSVKKALLYLSACSSVIGGAGALMVAPDPDDGQIVAVISLFVAVAAIALTFTEEV